MKFPQKHTVQFWLLALIPAGLLFSRILLSCSLIGFIVLTCLHKDLPRQCRRLLKDPALASLTLLFFVPMISGLWSEDLRTWSGLLRIKLPLLLLPLAFAGDFRITPKQHRVLSACFVIAVLAGTFQTIFMYIGQAHTVNDAYLRSQVMTTPMYDDHVRFSWMLSLAVLTAGWLGADRWRTQRILSLLAFLVCGWMIVFLHILAARTGIFSLYIILLTGAAYRLFRIRKPVLSVAVITFLLALPVVAYYTMPSFHNRARVVIYEYDYFRHFNYLPGSNDAVRMISVKAGWELMRARPLTGSGFGDVKADARNWYGQHYPQMQETDKKIPGSEWIVYAAGAGIPGLIIFAFVMGLPFFKRTRLPWIWYAFHLTAAMSMLTDVGLEVQIGVALYVFMCCWWGTWLGTKNNPSLQAV